MVPSLSKIFIENSLTSKTIFKDKDIMLTETDRELTVALGLYLHLCRYP